MKNQTTTTTNKNPEFTIDDLKKCADYIYKRQEPKLPKGLSWFTKLMNRFGWHREYEVLVIDKKAFNFREFKPLTLD